MKFTLTVPTASIRRKLRKARAELLADRPTVLRTIGVAILSDSQQAYRTKSRGGVGSDGIRWSPLKPSTIAKKNRRGKQNANRKTTKSGKARPAGGIVAIGIDTGLQLASGSPGFNAAGGGNILRITDRDVVIGYGRSYSRYFDEKRPAR